MDGVLNFLYHSDKILSKEDYKFSLTKFGLDNLFTDPVLAMSYGAVGAYSCVLTELVPSLRNQKKYGKDYIRPGDLIAKGSYYTGRKNYPWIVDSMKKLGVKKIEYLELIDLNTNTKVSFKTKKFKIFIAYYLNNIRLIDNV